MPTEFTVMTWNVENLYPAEHEYGPDSRKKYNRKVKTLARTIKDIDPDIVAVQEIGSADSFLDLLGSLGGLYPYARLSFQPDSRGLRVAFLSKLELHLDEYLQQFPYGATTQVVDAATVGINQFERGVLKVQVTVEGLPINLVTAHLTSKHITYSGNSHNLRDDNARNDEASMALLWHIGEAIALGAYINDLILKTGNPTIVLGCLNEVPKVVNTRLMRSLEMEGLRHPDQEDARLYNLSNHIPKERRFSQVYPTGRELIDHILISFDLIPYLRQVDSFVQTIEGTEHYGQPQRNSIFPNHAPVFTRFALP